MELKPSPVRRHLKTSSEFLAGLTPEKLDGFIEPVMPAHNGDDWTLDSVQRLADAIEKGERDLVPVQERLDALTFAQAEGWTPTRGIESQLCHLRNVVCGRYVAKYLKDILSTLQEAEADLATWPTQRAERLAECEREKATAEEQRVRRAEIRKQQDAFYSAFFAMGISPIPMGNDDHFDLEFGAKRLRMDPNDIKPEHVAWQFEGGPLPTVLKDESAKELHALERQISNMGNHLYE